MILPLLASLSLAVQPDSGALALRLDDKPVLTGVLAPPALKPAKTTVHQDSPDHYTVHVDYTDGSTAAYTCALQGADCTLEYTLTNGADHPQTLDLAGLTCVFTPGAPMSGTIPNWHPSYYADHGVWHPGLNSPLGAVYATDGQTAAVFYSPSEWNRQSLINATRTVDYTVLNPLPLELHTLRTVASGASDTVSLVVRLTHDLSPAGLHGGYKAFLDGKFPHPLHVPDPRPVAQFSSVDAAWVTPDDPHGYNGDHRRIDLPAGVAAFLHLTADPLQAAHGSGVIFWAPGGVDSVMYPPDFDVNLARIADTWPLLVDGFQQRGLRVGLCARAAEVVDRSDPAHPRVSLIDPDNAAQVETLLNRFRRVARTGVNAYYLDSFGNDLPSTRLLPAIRAVVGPTVPLYSEYCTDATLPYADRYCEYHGGDTVQWDSPEQLQALQFLFPDAVWLCISRTPDPLPPDFARLHLTPLIQDYQVKTVWPPAP